jgi:hypothetical protein
MAVTLREMLVYVGLRHGMSRKISLMPAMSLNRAGSPMSSKVDPAALLIAVLAVGVNPFFEAGLWDRNNLIIACIVLVVVLCFTFPRRPAPGEELPGFFILFAQSVVYAFVIAVGSAWLHQLPLDPGEEQRVEACVNSPEVTKATDPVEKLWQQDICERNLADDIAEQATNRALETGAIALVGSLAALWLRVRWLKHKRSPDQAVESELKRADKVSRIPLSFATMAAVVVGLLGVAIGALFTYPGHDDRSGNKRRRSAQHGAVDSHRR